MCVYTGYKNGLQTSERQPVTAARRAAMHLVVCATPYMRGLGMCLR